MAERLVNEFTVNRPIDEAWAIVCDLQRIAPCLPGARLEETDGETHRGSVRVKLGSIAAEFRGEASFVERDDTTRTATLVARGRDVGNRGSASARILARAHAESDAATRVVLETELSITGKVAQLGRGVMNEVSRKLLAQFADNLDSMLAVGTTPGAHVEGRVDRDAGEARQSPERDVPERDVPERDVPERDVPEGDVLDLGAIVGPALVKRLLPGLAGLLVLVLVVWRLRRR